MKQKNEFYAVLPATCPPSSCISYPTIYSFDSESDCNDFIDKTGAEKREDKRLDHTFGGHNPDCNNWL